MAIRLVDSTPEAELTPREVRQLQAIIRAVHARDPKAINTSLIVTVPPGGGEVQVSVSRYRKRRKRGRLYETVIARFHFAETIWG